MLGETPARVMQGPAPPASRYDTAGPGSRFCAAALDTALSALALLIVSGTVAPRAFLALSDSGRQAARSSVPAGVRAALPVVAIVAVSFLYQGISEIFVGGRTLGKRVMGLRAISADGAPLTKGQALVRNLLRAVDVLPLGYAVGGLLACVSPSSQRLGDLLARTLVIKDGRRSPARAVRGGWSVAPPAAQSVMPLPDPAFELSPNERAMVTGFLERRAALTPFARAAVGEQIALRLYNRHGGTWVAPESYLERLAVGRHRG